MFNSNSALKLNPKIGEEKGLNYISSLSTESLKKNLLNPTTLLKVLLILCRKKYIEKLLLKLMKKM